MASETRGETQQVDDLLSSVLRTLPSVDQLLQEDDVIAASTQSNTIRAGIIRRTIAQARLDIRNGWRPSVTEIKLRVIGDLSTFERPRLISVLNGTGVIIHTNLGRAPVSRETARAMSEAATTYVPLELDVVSGERGGRMSEIATLMQALTGAEAVLVVNNNAAAVLLVLSALGNSREVIVSRGEAVEIGGGFRIPDVLRQSGATLVEVGTTNRTYPRDYRDAVSEHTALILKVHPSNFSVAGFTRTTSVAELVQLDLPRSVPVVEDLGSGALLDTSRYGLAPEPMIEQSLLAGASIVTASGDKLLGGPQAGIIAGRGELVERIAKHPLARAVRADKSCLAGVAATLRHYTRGDAETTIPVWRMISTSQTEIETRVHEMARRLEMVGIAVAAVQTDATVGGGSLPGEILPSWAVGILPSPGRSAAEIAKSFRTGTPPVFPRIEEGRVLIDLRTILPEDDESLFQAIVSALA